MQNAVEYCKENGVEFYAVNKSYPEEKLEEGVSRKINADIFIDDRNIGGFLGWGEIYQILHPNDGEYDHQYKNAEAHHNYKSKNSLLKKLPWLKSKPKKK